MNSKSAQRQIIARIPQRGMTGEQLGFAVENELTKLWIDSMTASERAAFSEAVDQRRLEDLPKRLFNRLDRVILSQAQTLGWRITLSDLVRFRMSEWDGMANGPDNFRRFGLACAKSARILQKREPAPLDPDLRTVKAETVAELRLVLKTLRAQLATQRRALSAQAMRHDFATFVAQSPSTFPHLWSNGERWDKFFEENPDMLSPASSERVKPGFLFDEFLAWSTGREPRALRQAIASLSAKV